MKFETYIFENNQNDLPLYTILGVPEEGIIKIKESKLLNAFSDSKVLEYKLSKDENFKDVFEYFCDIALEGRLGFKRLVEQFELEEEVE